MKKIAFTCAIATIIASVSISSNYQTNSEQINKLLLENVECLSFPETGNPSLCMGIGSVDCPNTYLKVIYYVDQWKH